jgi:hypothetical protein
LLFALLVLASWNGISPRSTTPSLLEDILQAHPQSDDLANAQALFQVNIGVQFAYSLP